MKYQNEYLRLESNVDSELSNIIKENNIVFITDEDIDNGDYEQESLSYYNPFLDDYCSFLVKEIKDGIIYGFTYDSDDRIYPISIKEIYCLYDRIKLLSLINEKL